MKSNHNTKYAMLLAVLMLGLGSLSYGQFLPNTGQQISPLAPNDSAFVPLNPALSDNPDYLAGQAATSVVSPDGKTLLVLTSGYNLVKNSSNSVIADDSTQFVFVYDISQYRPVQKQAISVPNTYNGIAFDPSGTAFYVSGEVNDSVHIFVLQSGAWVESATSPVALGHLATASPPLNLGGLGLEVKPHASYWAEVTKGMDFSVEDHVDGRQFNRILWQGLKGSQPYPETPSGLDLRANRQQLLERYRANLQPRTVPFVESSTPIGGGGK